MLPKRAIECGGSAVAAHVALSQRHFERAPMLGEYFRYALRVACLSRYWYRQGSGGCVNRSFDQRLFKCDSSCNQHSTTSRPNFPPAMWHQLTHVFLFYFMTMGTRQTQQSNIVMIVKQIGVTDDHGFRARITSRKTASSTGESKDTCISCNNIKRMRIHSNGAE